VAVIQRMSSVQVLPLGNYANGARELGPVDIADDVTSILISFARCTSASPTIWPNASTILTITPQVSVDAGASWVECGASVSPGGISFFRGNEVAFGQSGGGIPPAVNGVTRQYKCTVNIVGGPLRSSVTVEVT
jgi:hypothetical protein